MKLSEVIEYCAGVERLIAEVYDSFAERWPDPPTGTLWRELAREERVHGALLDGAARMPAAHRVDPSFDRDRLDSMRSFVRERLPSGDTTLDQALGTALDLESLELDNVYRRLFSLTADDSRMSSVFRLALGQFGRHESRILETIERISTDARLVERAAREREHLLRHPVLQAAAE